MRNMSQTVKIRHGTCFNPAFFFLFFFPLQLVCAVLMTRNMDVSYPGQNKKMHRGGWLLGTRRQVTDAWRATPLHRRRLAVATLAALHSQSIGRFCCRVKTFDVGLRYYHSGGSTQHETKELSTDFDTIVQTVWNPIQANNTMLQTFYLLNFLGGSKDLIRYCESTVKNIKIYTVLARI